MKSLGRPTVMTPQIIAKLEEAFADGASDAEAIFYAGISKTAFYDFQKDNDEFTERKEGLRDMVKYRVRKNIVKKINEGDLAVSQWYAERKMKNEFSSRSELTGAEGGEVNPDKADRERANAALAAYLGKRRVLN